VATKIGVDAMPRIPLQHGLCGICTCEAVTSKSGKLLIATCLNSFLLLLVVLFLLLNLFS